MQRQGNQIARPHYPLTALGIHSKMTTYTLNGKTAEAEYSPLALLQLLENNNRAQMAQPGRGRLQQIRRYSRTLNPARRLQFPRTPQRIRRQGHRITFPHHRRNPIANCGGNAG